MRYNIVEGKPHIFFRYGMWCVNFPDGKGCPVSPKLDQCCSILKLWMTGQA